MPDRKQPFSSPSGEDGRTAGDARIVPSSADDDEQTTTTTTCAPLRSTSTAAAASPRPAGDRSCRSADRRSVDEYPAPASSSGRTTGTLASRKFRRPYQFRARHAPGRRQVATITSPAGARATHVRTSVEFHTNWHAPYRTQSAFVCHAYCRRTVYLRVVTLATRC